MTSTRTTLRIALVGRLYFDIYQMQQIQSNVEIE